MPRDGRGESQCFCKSFTIGSSSQSREHNVPICTGAMNQTAHSAHLAHSNAKANGNYFWSEVKWNIHFGVSTLNDMSMLVEIHFNHSKYSPDIGFC